MVRSGKLGRPCNRPRQIVADCAYSPTTLGACFAVGTSAGHPTGAEPQATRPVKQGCLPAAQSGGAPLCPYPTVPADGDPLREARGPLFGNRHAGRNSDLAEGACLTLQARPTRYSNLQLVVQPSHPARMRFFSVKTNKLRIQVDALLWIVLILSNPFVLSYAFGINYRLLIAPLSLLVFSHVFLNSKYFRLFSPRYILLVSAQLAFLLLHAFYVFLIQGAISPLYLNVIVLYTFIVISLFVVSRSQESLQFFLRTFYAILVIIGLLSIVGFLCHSAGLLQPISTFPRFGVGQPINNFGLFFSFVQIGPFPRSSGFFDEPGTFGFYITLALIVGSVFRAPYRYQFILYIAGFTTLSVAYFFAGTLAFLPSFVGLILSKRRENLRRLLYSFILLVFSVVIPVGYILSSLGTEELSGVIWHSSGRISNAIDGVDLSFNDRATKYRLSVEAFSHLPLTGVGIFAHSDTDSAYSGNLCCNPIAPLAQAGILGYLVMNVLPITLVPRLVAFGPVYIGSVLALLIYQISIPSFFDGPLLTLVFVSIHMLMDAKNSLFKPVSPSALGSTQ